MKTILEFIERSLAVFLSTMACMGMFLVGCLAGNLICGEVSTSTMWAIFLGCLIITYAAVWLLTKVRYKRLEMLADELDFQKDKEAQELYEHLGQGL